MVQVIVFDVIYLILVPGICHFSGYCQLIHGSSTATLSTVEISERIIYQTVKTVKAQTR